VERQVIFRDYQEQVAADHNNIQAFSRDSIDSLAHDVVSAAKRFSGFTVSKTGQVEIKIDPGKLYDGGAVYARRSQLVQSLATYTAAVAKRIVTVSAYGNENLTDTQTRDYLTNVDTGEVEPRAASMTSSRDAQIVFTAGAEAADPVPPPVPATHILIATILMDPTQVVSVTMVDGNKVVSTDVLDTRADALETFRSQIEPRVASLASDISDLANRLSSLGSFNAMYRIMEDVSRVKETLRFPPDAQGYGSDFYLLSTGSDTTNASALGYDAKVEEGVRFPDANVDEFEISLFSANDPNAANVGGLLLPKYDDILKISTGAFDSDLGIAQYGYQTHSMKQGYISRSRVRYGGGRTVCTNGVNWDITPGQPAPQNLYDFETTDITTYETLYGNGSYIWTRQETYWFDTWKEPFMYAITTDHTVVGAQVAQTFLVSNDMYATKLGFYITAKGANEDIHIALCEVSNGQPDLDKVVLKTVYAQADIVIGWNRFAVPPTFLAKGKRYALVFISNANHKVGMASGQSYLDGTFFYSTDGIYYQGDLTKDMMLEVWGAKFRAAQVAIEFAPINLDGGFRDIDILAEMWVPQSTQLVFEMRPNGTGEWLPLVNDNGAILATSPPLAQFRARFVGTSDMQPMIHMTGSRVRVSRPKTVFKHISNPITVPALAGTADNVTVKVILEEFDETPNDHSMTLRVGSSNVSPHTTVTKALPDAVNTKKRFERTYKFSAAGGTTSFRIVQDGTATSAQLTYHVAERTFYTA
jgi:hypothetical protein